ncbi:MAG: hypothetical protein N0C84_00890 [Candidatus Thiodiazotropha taylori]|uniref:Uncharacterized protein n=1 Tax=Candidatus Thiodiazotropha taylori TaxID=2792791 RepID=A0A9E4KA92_9GAMM|nr:hypothetical protein [Candidatus Thiodiazotropha taylori]MCW4255001.1 hypothetical protein [Candidatus Thiodiazotropha taylori]
MSDYNKAKTKKDIYALLIASLKTGEITTAQDLAIDTKIAEGIPKDVSELTDTSNKFFSGSYTDLTNTPTLFSGSYTDLTNTPTLFSGSYTDLTNTPTIPADVSELTDTSNKFFSGSYTDLTNTPTIPADVSGDITTINTSITNIEVKINEIIDYLDAEATTPGSGTLPTKI